MNVGGSDVLVPAPEVNLLLLSSHILKHALGVGIGLRQFCDMAVACNFYADRVDPREMEEIYRKAGLEKWSVLLDGFLGQYLGLEAGETKKSNVLLDIILKGGNFGRFTGKCEKASQSVLARKWHTFTSFMGNVCFAMTYAPGEWFWTMVRLAGGQVR